MHPTGGSQFTAAPATMAIQSSYAKNISMTSLFGAAWRNHRLFMQPAHRDAVRCCCLHYRSLLVYFINFLCEQAVTLGRAASNTFAGIRPMDAAGSIIAQVVGATAATLLFTWLYPAAPKNATVGGTVAPSAFADQPAKDDAHLESTNV
jgi:hypothetical protein